MNQKSRRAKLTADKLQALADLGLLGSSGRGGVMAVQEAVRGRPSVPPPVCGCWKRCVR
ncbi:hypothetical protein ACFYSF_48435 [Streptomyces canus]|uniref:hypothetical protein n=1 Tax=Streptomyces canus TaxID=58343 RepID=UPI0036BB5E52